MSRLFELVREDGWAQVVPRVFTACGRRLRDAFTARRLGAAGFRAGRSPRLYGLKHMHIGRNFSAGDHVWIEAIARYAGQSHNPQLLIGDGVSLSNCVHIACLNKITIGSGLLSGSNVIVSDHSHGVYRGPNQCDPATVPAQRPLSSIGEIEIGRNVWLGDGVAVLAGARIGDGAIIGANSVVTGTIPPATIAAGAPARPLRRWHPETREWLRLA